LCKEVLKYNAGDYNAWYLRRKIIDELNLPIKDEMKFLNEVGILLEEFPNMAS